MKVAKGIGSMLSSVVSFFGRGGPKESQLNALKAKSNFEREQLKKFRSPMYPKANYQTSEKEATPDPEPKTDPTKGKPIPHSPQLGPYSVMGLEMGETYKWCSCGRSDTQPFCNGQGHEGTPFKPIEFKLKRPQPRVPLCGCKRGKKTPYCDTMTCMKMRKIADTARQKGLA